MQSYGVPGHIWVHGILQVRPRDSLKKWETQTSDGKCKIEVLKVACVCVKISWEKVAYVFSWEITLTASLIPWLSCLPISAFLAELQRKASLVLPIVAHTRVGPACALGKTESCWRNGFCWCNQRLLPSLWIRGQHWAKALKSVHSWAFFFFFFANLLF